MGDKIIFSTGIFRKVPVSYVIAYQNGQVVHVDFLHADLCHRSYAGRIERITDRPAGAFVRLDESHQGFLERKYFDAVTFYRQREGIDRTRHPLIDGDCIYVTVTAMGKGAKRAVLKPYHSKIDAAEIREIPSEIGTGDELTRQIAEEIITEYGLVNPQIIDALSDAGLQREMTMVHKTDSLIDALLSKKVWLKNGGNLIIEECETAVLIDVNTSGTAKKSADAFEQNCMAYEEAIRQITLRHLSGMILIDFLKMGKADTLRFGDWITEHMPAAGSIFYHDITPLGIGEFTAEYRTDSLFCKFSSLRKKVDE